MHDIDHNSENNTKELYLIYGENMSNFKFATDIVDA